MMYRFIGLRVILYSKRMMSVYIDASNTSLNQVFEYRILSIDRGTDGFNFELSYTLVEDCAIETMTYLVSPVLL